MRLCDLGALSIDIDGHEQSPGGKRPATVLALLLVHANHRVSVDTVVDAVWGARASAGSASTLESHIWRLRRVLEPDRPAREPSTVLINQAGGYRLLVSTEQVDSLRFAQLADEIADLMTTDQPDRALPRCDEALGLWRGRPFGPLSDELWAAAAVARLEEQRRQIQERRIDALLATRQAERALADVEALIHEMPYNERARSQQMLALYRCGRPEDALSAYLEARAALLEEVGIEPGAELQELQRRILTQDASLVQEPVQAPPPRPADIQLPGRTSEILGRDRELNQLLHLLAEQRLMTLVGPAGAGKTRLGLEVAARSATVFRDGVWFADLAAITDPVVIVPTLMSTIGLQPPTVGSPLDALVSHLHGRAALLVLDNCEHLMPDISEIASRLVGGNGEVSILATSREPLGLSGERLFTVGPLEIDSLVAASDVGDLAPAIELFLRRAKDAAPDRMSELPPESARGLAARICSAVDGLPLAIELAAARAQAYTLAEIAEQVQDDPSRLSRLTGRAGERGSSLRATLDWSDRLISDPERSLHRNLTVLPGPFTAAAASGVSDPSDWNDRDTEAGDLLPLLVERSLLVGLPPSRPGGPSLFRQLATVRAHAARGLEDAGATARQRDRRRAWALGLTERRPAYGSFAEAAWYYAIDDDLPAVRGVLEDEFRPRHQQTGPLSDGVSVAGVMITTRLIDYWYYRSQTADSAAWMGMVQQALGSGVPLEPAEKALALAGIASIRCLQGRADLAAPFIGRILAQVGQLPDDRRVEVGHALGLLSSAIWSTDDVDLLCNVHVAMAAISDDVGDERLAAFSDAIDCLIALPATELSESYRRAAALYDRAMSADHAFAAWTAAGACSIVALQQGRPAEGLRWTDRIIDIHWRLGTRRGGWYLETRANLTCLAEDYEQAAALFAAARSHNRRGGIAWPRRSFTTDLQNRAAKALGEERFARAWRRGEQWSLADVLESGST